MISTIVTALTFFFIILWIVVLGWWLKDINDRQEALEKRVFQINRDICKIDFAIQAAKLEARDMKLQMQEELIEIKSNLFFDSDESAEDGDVQ